MMDMPTSRVASVITHIVSIFVCTAALKAACAAPPAGCDPHWDLTVGASGPNGPVWATVASEDPDRGDPVVLAGGMFTSVGDMPAERIAVWHPASESWTVWPVGFNDHVRVLAVLDAGDGPALYAGGQFTSAGDLDVNQIARWDDAAGTWSNLGSGMGGSDLVGVLDLAVFDDGTGPALYVGGIFETAGGVTVNNIARWDHATETWSNLGGGLNGIVRALAVYDDGTGPALYAAGDFTTTGTDAVNRIARWNPQTQQWLGLGGGMNGKVHALLVVEDGLPPGLYAGGGFTEAGGIESVGIARWDGQEWSTVPGIDTPGVLSLEMFNDGSGPALYAGGPWFFVVDYDGPTFFHGLARWDGVTWSSIGDTTPGIHTMTALRNVDSTIDKELYIAGALFFVDRNPVDYIAAWQVPQAAGPADLNCDGVVGVADLLLLLGSWGACEDCNACHADFTGDCNVGVADLLVLLSNWG